MATQHRKHRGYKTQALVAQWFRDRGWPYAESTGASRQGVDVTGTPDIAVEVKARTNFNPLAWVRQAVAAADGRLPFVVVRCNGQGETSIADWPCLIRLADLTQLLHDAGYGDPATATPDPTHPRVEPSTDPTHREAPEVTGHLHSPQCRRGGWTGQNADDYDSTLICGQDELVEPTIEETP